jgi:putative redox protein
MPVRLSFRFESAALPAQHHHQGGTMSTTTVVYRGELQCGLEHPASGQLLVTDVPIDRGGQNAGPSPTDLVAAALGSCLLTTLAFLARRNELPIQGANATVVKELSPSKPQRISRLSVTIRVPQGGQISEPDRQRLSTAIEFCTVHHSLHPEIDVPVEYVWE